MSSVPQDRSECHQVSISRRTNARTVVDLFAGGGGLSLGASRAGFSVIGAVEFDAVALETHRHNFRATTHISTDIAELSGEQLARSLGLDSGEITGIIGGPPCQGFSVIGRNCSDDPRNTLFDDFFRLVSQVEPRFFLAENVPGILNKKNARIMEKAIERVAERYVVLTPLMINASDYGAPTTRRRTFFVGYLRSQNLVLSEDSFKPDPLMRKNYVRDALRGVPGRISAPGRPGGWRTVGNHGSGYFADRLKGHVPPGVGDPAALRELRNHRRVSGFLGTVHSEDVQRRYARVPHGVRDAVSKSHRLDPNGFCPTLRAGTGPEGGRFQAVRPLHPHQDRVVTPREAARLQGFPDWFQFSPTRWHSFRSIGASVSPIVAERILSVLGEALDRAEVETRID